MATQSRLASGAAKKATRPAAKVAAKPPAGSAVKPGAKPAAKPPKPTGKPATVAAYLAALPDDRRAAIEAVRKVILKNLDKDYEEGMQYGMIGYYIPHRIFPAGYHCDPRQPLPFAGLASQKNHMAIYLMCQYGSPAEEAWFRDAWTKTGKKLDMGKSCVRFKKLDDVPLEVVGEAIKRVPAKLYIKQYEAALRK